MYRVRVIIKGKYAFTPDTESERNDSIIMEFYEHDANQLVDGFGVDISIYMSCLN
jgi:hypothetical protein